MADKRAKTPFPAAAGVGARVAAQCQENGLIVRAMGDTIALCPPLIITEGEIDEVLARLGRSLDQAAAGLPRQEVR